MELGQGNGEQARSLAEESRRAFQRTKYKKGEALSLDLLGGIAFEEGEHERAFELLERSAALCGETGFRWFQAAALLTLAERARETRRYANAARWAREALAVGHQIGDRQWIVYSLAVLAHTRPLSSGIKFARGASGAPSSGRRSGGPSASGNAKVSVPGTPPRCSGQPVSRSSERAKRAGGSHWMRRSPRPSPTDSRGEHLERDTVAAVIDRPMEPIRLGIVGCGGISESHARAAATCSEVSIVACCDVRLDIAEEWSRRHGFEQRYGDYLTMVREHELDAVLLATWPIQHCEQLLGCLEAGVRSILCRSRS